MYIFVSAKLTAIQVKDCKRDVSVGLHGFEFHVKHANKTKLGDVYVMAYSLLVDSRISNFSFLSAMDERRGFRKIP